MNIVEFEHLLWTRDGVRVVVRAPTWAVVHPTGKTSVAADNMTVTEYIRVHVKNSIGPYQCELIDGRGQPARGRTLIGKVRASYAMVTPNAAAKRSDPAKRSGFELRGHNGRPLAPPPAS